MSESLTIYQIEHELDQLIHLREEMDGMGEDLSHIDQEIAEYCAREIAKVDGIRSYLQHCESMAAMAVVEESRVRAARDGWLRRADRLKSIVLRVMQDSGKTRIDGATGALVIKKNPPAVEVYAEGLLPAEYMASTVVINGRLFGLWQRFMGRYQAVMQDLAPDLWAEWTAGAPAAEDVKTAPRKRDIAAALKQSCGKCFDKGAIHVDDVIGDVQCPLCGGTGKSTVPGARMVQGERLDVI